MRAPPKNGSMKPTLVWQEKYPNIIFQPIKTHFFSVEHYKYSVLPNGELFQSIKSKQSLFFPAPFSLFVIVRIQGKLLTNKIVIHL